MGSSKPSKPCVACGRAIEWRKKWERDWDRVKFCSERCKRTGKTPTDQAVESAILAVVRSLPVNASVTVDELAALLPEGAGAAERVRAGVNRMVASAVLDLRTPLSGFVHRGVRGENRVYRGIAFDAPNLRDDAKSGQAAGQQRRK